MIEALFNQNNYVATKKLMDATALRQEAIASNLANVETPGYKRLDVAPSFKDELNLALNNQESGQIAQVEPRLAVDDTAISQGRDGNTVQLETELLKMNQNSVAHALETRILSGSMARLRLAITGK